MSPRWIVPPSGSCNVARIRISVDLPAPFGPSSPYMPVGIVRETSLRAWTPLGYVFDTPRMLSSMSPAVVVNKYFLLQSGGGRHLGQPPASCGQVYLIPWVRNARRVVHPAPVCCVATTAYRSRFTHTGGMHR